MLTILHEILIGLMFLVIGSVVGILALVFLEGSERLLGIAIVVLFPGLGAAVLDFRISVSKLVLGAEVTAA